MNKEALLQQIEQGISSGVISVEDVLGRLNIAPEQPLSMTGKASTTEESHSLGAVDVMFYIGGLILFTALMTLIGQSWSDGSWILHVALSAGSGAVLWAAAWVMGQRKVEDSDINEGMTNALVLTGSLSVIVGGFIIMNEMIGGFDEINLIPGAVTFALLGLIHWAYDRVMRNTVVTVLGLILGVLVFPSLMYGLLGEVDVPADVYGIIVMTSGVLLAVAARMVARVDTEREFLRESFDSLAVTLVLGTMFVFGFGGSGVIWQLLLPFAVLGAFYVSIIRQSKQFLRTASFFLIVDIIYTTFRYLSGLGPVVGLVLSAFGILGVAMAASRINKKYIK